MKTLKVAERGTLNDVGLRLALKLIEKNQEALINSFKKVKEGKKITTIKLK